MSSHGSVSAAGKRNHQLRQWLLLQAPITNQVDFFFFFYIRDGARSTLEINLNTF